MKKLGLAVWSLTMIGATTVGVSVLCAAAWVNGLISGAKAAESKNEDPSDPPEEDEATEEEVTE